MGSAEIDENPGDRQKESGVFCRPKKICWGKKVRFLDFYASLAKH